MKLKRLKHQSYVLCHMFCGWQLYPDWARLAQLGNGVLEIDVLSETCKFNSENIEKLAIAGALRSWLLQDLETSGIPLEQIESAKLTVQLRAGFDKRTGLLNYNHDFLLEGEVAGGGEAFRTMLEDKDGHQRVVEA